jgi:type II secretory pathway pseudopilin PulG
MKSRKRFTLLEIVISIGIFAVAITVLLEQRNQSLEKSYMATQLVKAQHIVDEVLAVYRLQPFSKEVKNIEKDYSPFEVNVDVSEESINIIPKDWRVEFLSEEQEKKKRTILRVSVDVGYGSYLSDEITEHLKVSTLIRLIELEEEDDS